MWYAIGAVLVVAGCGIVYLGSKRRGLKSEMDRLATTDVAKVGAGGQVEVKGQVSCDAPIRAPHANVECIYYSYDLERRERSGGSSSSSGSRHRWVTIDSGSGSVPFVLTDGTGSIAIDPEGATFDAPVVMKGPVRRESTGSESEGGLGSLLGRLAAFASPQRVTTKAIVLNNQLYVLGNALQGTDGRPRISKGEDSFFISTRSEEQIARSLGLQSMGFYTGGAVLAIGGLLLIGMSATGRL